MKFSLAYIFAVLLLLSCKNQDQQTAVSSIKPMPAKSTASSSSDGQTSRVLEKTEIQEEVKKIESSQVELLTESHDKNSRADIEKPKVDLTKKNIKLKTKTDEKERKKLYSKIEFEENIFDFGEIVTGDKIHHKFIFTNVGNAPLNIKTVDADCGCTQPSFPFIPIQPGETGYIGVDYNSVSKEGAQKPKIEVYSDALVSKHVLYLKGVILKEKNDSLALDSNLNLLDKSVDSLLLKTSKDSIFHKDK